MEVIEAEVVIIVIVAAIAQRVYIGKGFGRIFRFGWYLGIRLNIVCSIFSGNTAGVCCGIYNIGSFTIRVIVIRYNYVLLASIKYITSPCKLVM